MAIEVKIPSLGESITNGILSSWHVSDGEYVKEKQSLYDLETDKITTEGSAEKSGIISIKVSEGTEVAIGETIAVIDEKAQAPEGAQKTVEPETNTAEKQDSSNKLKTNEPKEPSPPLSPAVRRLAAETEVNPSTIIGTGKKGRVTKEDMLAASENANVEGEKKASVPIKTSEKMPEEERVSRKKMSPLRKRIAQRLVEAQQTAAILTTFNEVDMSTVIKLRKQSQDNFVKKNGIKLGFMSFFVKAAVHALKMVPQLNTQMEGDNIVYNHFYDIGVALSAPQGLMVPVVKGCDRLSFAQIEEAINGYVQKAKENKVTIDDLSGGVFTISNGGIFGSMLSTPILNPPQSGILGMHSIQERPVVRNGEVVVRPMMYLALSYDHRIIDGKEAVTFLVKIKEAIEDPINILLEI